MRFLMSVRAAVLFLVVFAAGMAVQAEVARNVTQRGGYGNSKFVFETTGKGRVAFLGGSITEMEGYRPMVCEYLQKKFPKTQFEFIPAGISSTCSDTGAFRLETDVLSHGPIDLFFLEYAVNDDQDGTPTPEKILRGFEGIVRHIRTACPNVDIVVTFFVNEHLIQLYREGQPSDSIRQQSRVTERYQISTINLAKEVQERIDAGTLTWKDFGGVHPAPLGNRICADMIESLLNEAWKTPATGLKAHALPAPLDVHSYANGGFRGFEGIQMEGFTYELPDWASLPGHFRETFAGQKLLCASQPGASCTFDFTGQALGLYVLAGPDAGDVEYSIDGGAPQKVRLFHGFSGGLHYPHTLMLADELAPGKHSVTLRVSRDADPRSQGTAVRILQICVQ